MNKEEIVKTLKWWFDVVNDNDNKRYNSYKDEIGSEMPYDDT